MRDSQPFMIAIGILCVWPAIWAFIAFMIGRNGLPFQLSERWRRKPKLAPIEIKRRSPVAPQPPAPEAVSVGSGD
jgi:hypothetical protein